MKKQNDKLMIIWSWSHRECPPHTLERLDLPDDILGVAIVHHAIGAALQRVRVIDAVKGVFNMPLEGGVAIPENRVGALPVEQQVPVTVTAHDFPGACGWILSFNGRVCLFQAQVVAGIGCNKGRVDGVAWAEGSVARVGDYVPERFAQGSAVDHDGGDEIQRSVGVDRWTWARRDGRQPLDIGGAAQVRQVCEC